MSFYGRINVQKLETIRITTNSFNRESKTHVVFIFLFIRHDQNEITAVLSSCQFKAKKDQ